MDARLQAANPADSAPTHERVYRILRDTILQGAMAPGESLTLRGVAEQMGASMTPAREAVRRLVAERALEMTGSGRVLVPVPDAARLDELFRARLLLEPELAQMAVKNADTHLISRLKALDAAIDDDLSTGDAAAYVRDNSRFHTLLYKAADAPALLALVESVWLQTAPMMRRVYGRLGTQGLADYHEAALGALTRGDAPALSAAIRADVAQGRELMRLATT
ncbi:MAG: GntR family transcriptional regulator [Pseudomonadota bacterium]